MVDPGIVVWRRVRIRSVMSFEDICGEGTEGEMELDVDMERLSWEWKSRNRDSGCVRDGEVKREEEKELEMRKADAVVGKLNGRIRSWVRRKLAGEKS